jgi:hypothetical protein
VASRGLGLRTHMAISHPNELRAQEQRQANPPLARSGPLFRCLLCDHTFQDLDWYASHVANDHRNHGADNGAN